MSLEQIQHIQDAVLQVLEDVQSLSGRPWSGLNPSAKPIGSLDGFDSLTAVEATVMVEQKLGCQNLGVDSIFVSEDGKHALTIMEIAQRISTLLASGEGQA